MTEENRVIEKILLREIKVDYDWNSRNKLSVLQEGGNEVDDESGKMTTDELSKSIEERGQDTPVHVILNPTKDKNEAKKFPYILIAGFKRYTAMHRLAERANNNKIPNPIKTDPSWSSKNPTIDAHIQKLSESEARMLNMRENTARANLTVPDTAYGIYQIYQSLKAENKPLPSDSALAADLGLSQGYVSKIHRILDAIVTVKNGEILKDWRTQRQPLSTDTMSQIAKQTTPDRVYEAYAAKVADKGADAKPAEKDENAWKERAKVQASDLGVTIGVLQSLGQIENGAKIDWASSITDLHHAVKIKKGADVKEIVEIARAAESGFIFGLSKLATEAAEEQKKEADKEAKKLEKKNAKADEKAEKETKRVEAAN